MMDTDAERRQYEASQKEYWDYTSTLETAERKGERRGIQKGIQQGIQQGLQQGLQQGILQEKAETVCRLKAMGLTIEQIAQGADISIDEVKNLLE